MRWKRFSEEQMIGILKENEAGRENREICRKQAILHPAMMVFSDPHHADQTQ